VDCRWEVIGGDRRFFDVTKRLHNRLHGAEGDGRPLDDDARRIYEQARAAEAGALAGASASGCAATSSARAACSTTCASCRRCFADFGNARGARAPYAQPMAFQPDDLLSEAALQAAVAALAERNQHHLADMNAAEQSDAVGHWRELAMTVLTAARTAAGPELAEGETGGRAAIVLEDAGGDEITVHASFYPQLEDLGGGEVAATPAQATALELLEQLAGEDDEEPEE
jgi:hypothetical protein